MLSRRGGYLRIIHLPRRKSDAAEMSLIELTERREKVKRVKSQEKGTKSIAPPIKDGSAVTTKDLKNKAKWYTRFKRKSREWE